MERHDATPLEIARLNARIDAESAEGLAAYLRAVPEEAWSEPSGCAGWTTLDLVRHVAGGDLLWAKRAREALEGPSPTGEETLDVAAMGPEALADTIESHSREFRELIDRAGPEQLAQPVQIPLGTVRLLFVTGVAATESVVHHWDIRAVHEPEYVIPSEHAIPLAMALPQNYRFLANPEGAAGASGTYALRVGDGIGPVTLTIEAGDITLVPGETGSPDVSLEMSAEAYLRLFWGRLDIREAAQHGTVPVTGDLEWAAALNGVFRGVGR